MINIDIIEKEILELESRDASWANIEHLAWLYIVHDHLTHPNEATTGVYEGSEFKRVCSKVPAGPLIEILAEHMTCIQVLHPKEYAAIISKIKGIENI